MSSKDCGHHDRDKARHHLILTIIAVFIALFLFVVFLVWIILLPTKPRFVLQEATVYVFNVSTTDPSTLTTSMQITVASKNRMGKVGIYYQKLDVYATYRSQQVTMPTVLPSTYQDHKEIAVWSPFLYGNTIPVAPGLMMALEQDLNVGSVLLNIRLNGCVKWQVGTWISGKYDLNVNCPAYIKFGGFNPDGGITVGPVMKFETVVQGCSVDV
ncbi:NDR1/HIN1-like protein 1 [Quercus lobata]|uniref:NDR1/HIN1-like protein 1 n=1 Tax=Quercus lobata TaxID=97700 RepID=UPI001244EC0A|nr:NDR1/HIN1-like protein 1 [Quercus lobata]